MNESRIADYLTDDIETCVGPNSGRYLEKFYSINEGRPSFNWCAAFFTYMWFPYRKMWKASAVLLVYNIISNLLFSVSRRIASRSSAFQGDQGMDNLLRVFGLSAIFAVILFIASGFLGDWLYCRHVTKVLDENGCKGRSSAEAPELEERLKKSGGTSWKAAVLFYVAEIGINRLLGILL